MALSMLAIVLLIIVNSVQSSSAASECKNYCSSGGACLKTSDGPKCICYPEWTGKRCETRQLVEDPKGMVASQADRAHLRTNLCEYAIPNLCKNGGVCYVNNSMFACHCPYPFKGDYCENRSECDGHCLNNGICNIVNNVHICNIVNDFPVCNIVNNLPICTCMPGWNGPRCQNSITTSTTTPAPTTNQLCNMMPRDYCAPGICVFTTTAVCLCPSTHTGDQCQIRRNQTIPNCSNDPNSHNPCATITTSSTSTRTISIQRCTVATCKNGGSCYNNGNSYYCYCRAPYTGKNCETLSG